MTVKPLLKWAGGKRQLLSIIEESMPSHYDNYFEPFFGGGALYFHLYEQGKVDGGIIGDSNPDLMSFYEHVRNDVEKLLDELHGLEFSNNREDYLKARAEYNELESSLRKSAILVYLNRHCFNGLYRVNMNGKFNVPFGKYRTTTYPSDELFHAVSDALKSCRLIKGGYRETCKSARKGDFIYLDPPYFPLSRTASFTSYSVNSFNKKEQEDLAEFYTELHLRGVKVLESNTDCYFIGNLYSDFIRVRLKTKTSINSVGKGRNGGQEVLISNYIKN